MAPEKNHSALHLLKVNMTTRFTAETPPPSGASPISKLPPEIMGAIVTHLGQGSDVTSLARVSSRFLAIASPFIWQNANSDLLCNTTQNAQLYAWGIEHFQYRSGIEEQDQRLVRLSFPLLKRLHVSGNGEGPIVIIDQFLSQCIESITIMARHTNNFFGKLKATSNLRYVNFQNSSFDLTTSDLNNALHSMRHAQTIILGHKIAKLVLPCTIIILSQVPNLVHLAIERPLQITSMDAERLIHMNPTPFNQLSELCVGVESEALALLMPKLCKLTSATITLTSMPSAALKSLPNVIGLRKIKLIFPGTLRFNAEMFDHLAAPAAEDFTLLVRDGTDLILNTSTIIRMREMFISMPQLKVLHVDIARAPQINGVDLLCLVGYTSPNLQKLALPSLYSIDMDDLRRERQLVFPNVTSLHLGRLISPMVDPWSMNADIKRFWLEVNSKTMFARFPNLRSFRVDRLDTLSCGVQDIIDYEINGESAIVLDELSRGVQDLPDYEINGDFAIE